MSWSSTYKADGLTLKVDKVYRKADGGFVMFPYVETSLFVQIETSRFVDVATGLL
jgi:hypothetical protein